MNGLSWHMDHANDNHCHRDLDQNRTNTANCHADVVGSYEISDRTIISQPYTNKVQPYGYQS